jgi:hypothetical protein
MGWRIAATWAGLVALAPFAAGDTITIDGVLYQNVYIRESEALYYVQDPATGKVHSVQKSAVTLEDVLISEDRGERVKLLKAWRAKRGEMGASGASQPRGETLPPRVKALQTLLDPPPAPPAEAKPDTPAAPEPIPLKTIGNRTEQDKSKRPVFINRTGAVIFTNRPEEYQGQSEYIEVTLQLEKIDVPANFRPKPKPGPVSAPEFDYETVAIGELVAYYAQQYALDANLVLAIIRQESNFNPNARSHAGACGLMQLMPGTAADMGVTDIFDPAQNIAGGTQYLAKMIDLFDGNVEYALAGYNAGPANVKKYNGIPPFQETQDYVQRVKELHRVYAGGKEPVTYMANAPKPAPEPPPDDKAPYTVYFKNGWVQPAEEIGESGDWYFVTIDGRTTQIRKSHVQSIKAPPS